MLEIGNSVLAQGGYKITLRGMVAQKDKGSNKPPSEKALYNFPIPTCPSSDVGELVPLAATLPHAFFFYLFPIK
jgi:hypothetical protein